MESGALFRLAAFTDTPEGGNPAGVWVGEVLPDPETMQRIAREVGYSETAFVTPTRGAEREVRYFSPEAEVPFCGHATIAAGVVLGQAEGQGTYRLSTAAGMVPVVVRGQDGRWEASLTSVEPRLEPAGADLLREVLETLGWGVEDLDLGIPPVRAFAGAWHVIVAASSAERLGRLDYRFEALKAVMLREGLTTVQLIWRENLAHFHARNPFPVGGVVEDPATGAAAAALGGYLRAARLIEVPATIVIRQGEAMGRPSVITVDIPTTGGIVVSGTAVML
ncbi:MAG: PhzF family phenazine biosynthesis protein [Gemmatimonadales bacterium]|nr:PhzF family phenazine biosynthesis protein [Gemmatimonadales bacterium]